LQQWVWQTAQQVVLLEEAPLRDYLEHIDGELEALRFGVSHSRYEDVLAELEGRLERELSEVPPN
jgi:hypothetical protein